MIPDQRSKEMERARKQALDRADRWITRAVAVYCVISVAAWGVIAFVAWHFIGKVW